MNEAERPWHIGVFFTGHNADTVDLPPGLSVGGDADGHVIGGSVLRFQADETPLAPVKVRVSHGCAPATAAAMLRKVADAIEQRPEILREEPGWQVRRDGDGTVSKKKITVEALRAAAADLPPELREQVFDMLGRIGPAIGDDDDRGPGDDAGAWG